MKDIFEQLEQEGRKADEALLRQYEKEYLDLLHGTGLSTQMTGMEIVAARTNLLEHIHSLRKSLGYEKEES